MIPTREPGRFKKGCSCTKILCKSDSPVDWSCQILRGTHWRQDKLVISFQPSPPVTKDPETSVVAMDPTPSWGAWWQVQLY